MQLQRFVILLCATLAASSQVWANTFTLVPMEEPLTQLASPASANPAIPAAQYGPGTVSMVTTTPLLCANTEAPTPAPGVALNVSYYSANGSIGASPLPFVFGASSASPATSAQAFGATLIAYNGNLVQFADDSLDALVCYGLDANGVHRLTRDMFLDNFELPVINSTLSVSVFHLPASASDWYGYTVDVTIPPLPSGTSCSANGLDCNFTLVEGYDSSVFATGSGQWCLAPAGAQGCSVPPPSGGSAPAYGDINVNYSNYATTVSLQAPIAPAPAKQYHFVAVRYFKSGVSALPASGAPVVIASLFSPLDLGENKLDDNVAVGANKLADIAPGVVSDAAYSTFSNKLASLQENTDSGLLTFNITDPDTIETSGHLLRASVTLNLNGVQVPVAANCGTATPITTLPVNRACTLDVPLNTGTFWDAVAGLPAGYAGNFNSVATDTTNGVYAAGVTASAQVVVTDSLDKASTPSTLAMHIFSTKNDAPVVSPVNATQWQSAPDSKQSNTAYQTFTCSIAANNCVSAGQSFHVVSMLAAIATQPGPLAAFDEIAAQKTAINDVQCGQLSEADAIFANAPVITQTSGSTATYDVTFQLNATSGSSLCKATFTDAMQSGAFPNAESAITTDTYFRVLVNP